MSRLLILFAALGLLLLSGVYVAQIGGAGLDLPSYLEGARRLIESGVPYHPDAFAGPLPMEAEMATTYRYSPLAAQLMVPLVDLPLSVVSAGAFVVLIAVGVAGIAAGARAGGADRRQSLLIALGLGGCLPVLGFGAHIGNVSPLFAAAVGASLLAPYRGSFLTVFVALLKPTALPLLLPLIRDRRLLIGAATAGALIVGCSLLIGSAAWGAYLQVAANVTAVPATTGYQAIGFGPALRALEIESFGVLAGAATAIAAGIAAVHWAPRDLFRSMAAAAIAAAMANPSASIHGIAPILPVVAARWRELRPWARLATGGGIALLSWWPAIFGGPHVGLVAAWSALIVGLTAESQWRGEPLDSRPLATEMEGTDLPTRRSTL